MGLCFGSFSCWKVICFFIFSCVTETCRFCTKNRLLFGVVHDSSYRDTSPGSTLVSSDTFCRMVWGDLGRFGCFWGFFYKKRPELWRIWEIAVTCREWPVLAAYFLPAYLLLSLGSLLIYFVLSFCQFWRDFLFLVMSLWCPMFSTCYFLLIHGISQFSMVQQMFGNRNSFILLSWSIPFFQQNSISCLKPKKEKKMLRVNQNHLLDDKCMEISLEHEFECHSEWDYEHSHAANYKTVQLNFLGLSFT